VRITEGELDTSGAHSIQETVVNSLADCRNEWQRNNVNIIQEAGANSLTAICLGTVESTVGFNPIKNR
jgi:hypothetical protein